MRRSLILIITFFAFSAALNAQALRSMRVIDGVRAFYMADFQGARAMLQEALLTSRLSAEDFFTAHVYIGFSYMREEIEPETARLHIVRAIQSAPEVELDQTRIPPDLYDRYLEIRRTLIGTLKVTTMPADATALLVVANRGRAMTLRTPAVFENLLEGTYNLLITRTGFKSHSAEVTVVADQEQMLEVQLEERRLSFLQKYWPYGAGALAATAGVAAILSVRGGEKPKPSTLPTPPDHPR